MSTLSPLGPLGEERDRVLHQGIDFHITVVHCPFSCHYNIPSVQQGSGGGRSAARCRHGQKGGNRCCGCSGDHGHWFLHQRCDEGRRVSLRDAEALGEGRQGAGGGIAEGAERRQECREEPVNPLIRFALAHAKQAPLHHLEGIGFQVDQNEEQPIFGCRQGAVLVDRKPAGGPRFPVEAPRRHMRLVSRLKGRDEELKLVERQAGQIQELRGAGLHIGESYTGHLWCLLSWEAQYIIIGINSNAWDAGSAKSILEAGAKAIATSSWAVAEAQGYRDGEAIPIELAEQIIGRIAATIDAPVTVDFEGGYSQDNGELTENIFRL